MYRGDSSTQPATVYVAGAVRDAAGVHAAPGAVALRAGRIVAAGPVEPVLQAAGPNARSFELDHRLLIPGLVNAHTHLDLTGVGYRPFTGDFVSWGKMIIGARQSSGGNYGPAVFTGAQLCASAGVLTVGDIAGAWQATLALRQTGLRGVSYAEVGGLGSSLVRCPPSAWLSVDRSNGVANGIQPHAPYSTGPAMYRSAVRLAAARQMPLATHLAELHEEIEFVAAAAGPMRRFLDELGKWDDRYLAFYGGGQHPVEWLFANCGTVADERSALTPNLSQGERGLAPRWLLAHCNYVEDAHIRLLAEHRASVAYCPRASEYFGHRNHRYRDMLAAGVNVCLGTDSIICHGTLSILDEMRRLYQRDRTDPEILLKMATVNGMRGLGLDEKDATFAPDANPGVVAIRYDPRSGVDPLERVLSADAPPEIEVLEVPQ